MAHEIAGALTRGTQTLVTCLFDLARRDGTGRRGSDFYFDHGRYVLGLDLPLVIFCDPDFGEWITDARGARPTRIVEAPLEDLETWTLYDGREQVSFENFNPVKDTPRFVVLTWSKFEMLERAARDNPFGTSHVAWIDLGIGHVASRPETFPQPKDGIGVLEMCAVAPYEVADPIEFYRFERGRLAGGFVQAPRERAIRFANEFRSALLAALDLGLYPNEQQVMSYVRAVRPELFDPHFGDYTDYLCNWDAIRGGVETVLLNLAHCRTHQLWEHADHIAAELARSVRNGSVELSLDQRARWLDESFVIAWQRGDPARCADLAPELLACAASQHFRSDRDRIMANLALVSGNASHRVE